MIATTGGLVSNFAGVGASPTSRLSGVSAGSGSGSGSGSGGGSAAIASLVDIQQQLGVDAVNVPGGGPMNIKGRPRTVSNLTALTGGTGGTGTEDVGGTPPDYMYASGAGPGGGSGLPRTWLSGGSYPPGLLGGMARETKAVRYYPCPSGCGHSCWAANDVAAGGSAGSP